MDHNCQVLFVSVHGSRFTVFCWILNSSAKPLVFCFCQPWTVYYFLMALLKNWGLSFAWSHRDCHVDNLNEVILGF